MPVKKLKEFLDQQNIRYVTCIHSTAYTAQQIAASAHIPGKEIAKTVMIKLDGQMSMATILQYPREKTHSFSKQMTGFSTCTNLVEEK